MAHSGTDEYTPVKLQDVTIADILLKSSCIIGLAVEIFASWRSYKSTLKKSMKKRCEKRDPKNWTKREKREICQKIAEKKKVHFFQRSDGLPEIICGTVDVPFKNSTSAKSGFELVKKIARLLHQELLDFKDVYFSWPSTEKQVLPAKYIPSPLAKAFLST